jgi:hypothetical protein
MELTQETRSNGWSYNRSDFDVDVAATLLFNVSKTTYSRLVTNLNNFICLVVGIARGGHV